MTRYVALLRGINVGGKNLVAMKDIIACVEGAGYSDVTTHAQSGNLLLTAKPGARALEKALEQLFTKHLGITLVVVVRSRDELAATIDAAPANHGSADLRSDVFFLKHPLTAKAALAEVPELREGVDSIAAGPGALYFSRVKARATKTRIQTFMAKPIFKQITVRTWGTVTKLLELLDR
jgi:uncharacterized protein (DUF1697 family)